MLPAGPNGGSSLPERMFSPGEVRSLLAGSIQAGGTAVAGGCHAGGVGPGLVPHSYLGRFGLVLLARQGFVRLIFFLGRY